MKEFQGAENLESWEEMKASSRTPKARQRQEGLEPLQAFVNNAALFSPDDMAAKRETNAVRLCTIHASKGLEFAVVFLVGARHQLHAGLESSGRGPSLPCFFLSIPTSCLVLPLPNMALPH